jgi:hypothetical protein
MRMGTPTLAASTTPQDLGINDDLLSSTIVSVQSDVTTIIPCNQGVIFEINMTSPIDNLEFSGVPQGKHYRASLYFKQDAVGARTLTLPTNISPQYCTNPEPPANSTFLIEIATRDGGLSWEFIRSRYIAPPAT